MNQPNNSEEQGADPGVGGLLRASRLRVGEDLPDIARMLCIRCPYLEAIEDGRYEDLPGSTYAAGFVRSYELSVWTRTRLSVVSRSRHPINKPRPTSIFGSRSRKRRSKRRRVHGLLIAAVGYGLVLDRRGQSPLAGIVPGFRGHGGKGKIQRSSRPPNRTPAAWRNRRRSRRAVGRCWRIGFDGSVFATPGDAGRPSTREPNPWPRGDGTGDDISRRRTAGTSEPTARGAVETAAENGPSPVTGSDPWGRAFGKRRRRRQPNRGSALSSRSNAEEVDGAATEDREAPMPWQSRADAGDSSGLAAESTREPVSVPEDNSASIPEPASEPDQKAPPPWVVEAVDNGGTVYGRENMNARIIVRAIANSYIQVRDEAAGEVLIARLLVKGDSYLVPNRDGLKLLAGNAGGIEILVDGEAAPSIRSAGIVRRGVVLDATRLKNGSAVER